MNAVHDIVMQLLPLREQRYIDPNKLLKLADRLKIRDVEAKIYFLRELLGIVRRLSLKIYGDPDDRLRLIDALQQALDLAIEEEEELLAAEE